MKFKALIILLIGWGTILGNGAYFVSFTEKGPASNFDPYQYFDVKALENKATMGLPIFDWYDLPVREEFVKAVQNYSDSIGFKLRWFNGVTAYCSMENAFAIEQLPFVKSVTPWEGRLVSTGDVKKFTEKELANFKIFSTQLNTMGGDIFQAKNLNGKGIRISIVDVGFKGANENVQLKHLFDSGRLVDSWDFAKNSPLDYKKGASHGSWVASFVFGKLDSFQVGHAVEAEALFAKMNSSMKSNKRIEEAWLKAVEWSHQKGARLVNSSVGYTGGKHTHEMLTGDSCKMTLAGNIAARKGMLIVNSAGNDGESYWKMISFPGDADSVLTVGAIDSKTGVRTGYSSFGPSKDLRLKPNVTAVGNVYYYNGFGLQTLEGTSFSSPLVTGFAACVLQNQTKLKPMDLIDTIQKSSSLYPYFDYSHGYGVPRASLYFGVDTILGDSASIQLKKSPNYLVEGYYYFKYLSHEGSQVFYEIIDKEGFIREYHVVKFEGKDESPKINYSDLKEGEIIRVFHRGTTIEEQYK